MGGDDLGSDDEFLGGGVVVDDDSDNDFKYPTTTKQQSVLKASTVVIVVPDEKEKNKKRVRGEENEATTSGATASKSKKKKSPHKVLLEAARSIEEESAEQQAAFTWTALIHNHRMRTGKDGGEISGDDGSSIPKPKLEAHHFKTSSKTSCTFESRLRDCVPSMKQLKTWKHKKSPMVLVVCISARRAVEILKDIKPFKVRAAKLFAKHMQVSQQEEMLNQSPFPMAVGTPHRLQVLCEQKALSLEHTKLIVLDAHKDAKNFTVCTLPDTAPHCMEFLKDHVLPELRKRPKECKLAFC